jgi:hypothetical protein
MAVLDNVRLLLSDPMFWARYFYAHEDGPGADRLGDLADDLEEAFEPDEDDEADDNESDGEFHHEVRFEVGDGYGLILDFDVSLDSYNLAAYGPDGPDAELGWDDLAHWHPYALRWSELDRICRALAAKDPELTHPGPALALLCRFAAVFDDDDVASAVAAVDAAYASLRPEKVRPKRWAGYWPRGEDWLERSDFRGERVTWHLDAEGRSWGEQAAGFDREFYSIRSTPPEPGEKGFPHDLLKAVLERADAVR